jgi:DNA-binding NtrC family response regulator
MKRILIVDDEDSILQSLQLVFKAEGHEVIALKDSAQVEQVLRTQDFDLLITDIRMTPIDGLQVLDIARLLKPSMPLMVCSALSPEKVARQLEDVGCAGFIRKPFKIEQALEIVGAVLNAGPKRT